MTNLRTIPADTLIAELRTRGYIIRPETPQDWITLTELARRCKVLPSSLHRTLARHPAAPGIQYDRAHTGKTRAVLATEEFHTWFQSRRRTEYPHLVRKVSDPHSQKS